MEFNDKKELAARINSIADYIFNYSVKWHKQKIILGKDKYGSMLCISVLDCITYYDMSLASMLDSPPRIPIPYKVSIKLNCTKCNFCSSIEYNRARLGNMGEDELVDISPNRRNCCVIVPNSSAIDMHTIAYWRPLKEDEIAVSTLRDFRRVFISDNDYRKIAAREAIHEKNRY
jgi:hypothetical protein